MINYFCTAIGFFITIINVITIITITEVIMSTFIFQFVRKYKFLYSSIRLLRASTEPIYIAFTKKQD